MRTLKQYRYSVLTFITDCYEQVHEVLKKDPEAEYLLVTDDENLQSESWNVVFDDSLKGLSPFDKCFFIRYHCFKYCHTDICLRIDGSIIVKDSLKCLIDIFEKGNYDASLMPHPFRDNFLDEYDVWVSQRNYSRVQADKCIAFMKNQGYDFSYRGMFQANYSIQRRNSVTDTIDERAFSLLKELGSQGLIERLDQIPFSFLMNTQFSYLKILPVSRQILNSSYLCWCRHNSNQPMSWEPFDTSKPDVKYMFNNSVTCIYLISWKDRMTKIYYYIISKLWAFKRTLYSKL